jgi:hypothetical protein
MATATTRRSRKPRKPKLIRATLRERSSFASEARPRVDAEAGVIYGYSSSRAR